MNSSSSTRSIPRLRLTQKQNDRIGAITAYSIVILASLIVILPLVWVFLTSLKTRSIAYSIPPEWFFTPTSENYAALLNKYPFPRYFFNSALVASAATLLGLIVAAPAAYSFARYNTGGNFLRGWVLNNRTMPSIVVLIPFFLLAQELKLQNTYTALVIAYLTFAAPFIIWMLISFFESVPVEIEEAARIDGA